MNIVNDFKLTLASFSVEETPSKGVNLRVPYSIFETIVELQKACKKAGYNINRHDCAILLMRFGQFEMFKKIEALNQAENLVAYQIEVGDSEEQVFKGDILFIEEDWEYGSITLKGPLGPVTFGENEVTRVERPLSGGEWKVAS